MKLYLKIWRQANSNSPGSFQNYEIDEMMININLYLHGSTIMTLQNQSFTKKIWNMKI